MAPTAAGRHCSQSVSRESHRHQLLRADERECCAAVCRNVLDINTAITKKKEKSSQPSFNAQIDGVLRRRIWVKDGDFSSLGAVVAPHDHQINKKNWIKSVFSS